MKKTVLTFAITILSVLSGIAKTPLNYSGKLTSGTCETTYGTDVQNVCSSYKWIDGKTYTTNNSTATFKLKNKLGCDSIVTLNLTILPVGKFTLFSAEGTDAQVVCLNSAITQMTYQASVEIKKLKVTGLPKGLNYAFLFDKLTVSGNPTESGVFNYTVTAEGSCATITGKITVNQNTQNTIILTSGLNSDNQSICINSPSTPITYSTVGATGASFTLLPLGVTGYWGAPLSNPNAKNQVNISGTPSVPGTYKYTVTLTGGCGVTTATGTIEVKPKNTIKLTSVAATAAQTVCKDNSIATIIFGTTTATGASASNLPDGVTGSWSANNFTISGTPNVAGTFTYTVTTVGGCSAVSASGTINSLINTIALSSAAGTDAQKVCKGTAIIPVTYATTNATGATLGGTLPTGVTGSWSANKFTISGTPTQSGTFDYTITLKGGCEPIMKTGKLVVNPDNTISLSTPLSDVQTICNRSQAIVPILYNTTGATGATISGLPLGVKGEWANNVVTLSGIPYVAGTYKYTVTLTGGCKALTATGTITVGAENKITLTSAAGTIDQKVKLTAKMTNITYSTSGATSADVTGLPTGVTGTWTNNILTISGTPKSLGLFTYIVNLRSVCPKLSATTGTITVSSNGLRTALSPVSASNIEVTSYPNPFSTAFKMNVVSQSEEPIAVQITDMVGRIVENHVINSYELSEKEIGEAYPVGVYNIVLTQGSETTTFRIVKQ